MILHELPPNRIVYCSDKTNGLDLTQVGGMPHPFRCSSRALAPPPTGIVLQIPPPFLPRLAEDDTCIDRSKPPGAESWAVSSSFFQLPPRSDTGNYPAGRFCPFSSIKPKVLKNPPEKVGPRASLRRRGAAFATTENRGPVFRLKSFLVGGGGLQFLQQK